MTRSGNLALHVIQNSAIPKQTRQEQFLPERQLDTLIEAVLLNPKAITFPNT